DNDCIFVRCFPLDPGLVFLRGSLRKTTMTDVKVALVTAFPRDPESPRGGVEVVSVVLARALADQSGRLDMHIVTTDPTARSIEQSTWEGMTIHRLPWTARRIFSGATGAAG